MDVLRPECLEEVLWPKRRSPGAVPIARGADLVVELGLDLRRPEATIDAARVPELRRWCREDSSLFLGSGVTSVRETCTRSGNSDRYVKTGETASRDGPSKRGGGHRAGRHHREPEETNCSRFVALE